jgi:glycosyltransferase involved in cell wall biosynthesis
VNLVEPHPNQEADGYGDSVKVLLSAYACEPGKGSEQEVGLRAMLAAARRHDVWVLTRENSIPLLEEFLAHHPLWDRIHLHGIDLDGPIRRVKRAGLPGLHIYYDAWQRLAAVHAAELDRRVDFDLVHHATFAAYWTRAGVSKLGKPFVWGPVGGGVTTPAPLLRELGAAGLRQDGLREAVRCLAAWRPSHGATTRAATVCLAQNDSTARRVKRDRVTVMPNALAVTLPALDPPEPRCTDIAFVGRLIPWKAGALAVRALRYVQHQDAVLRIFGDGPDEHRIRRAAERWGVQGRVKLVGSLPRDELLRQVRRCAVLLHPALHEEAGLSVAEALVVGVPVVCLNHGGPADLVRWWPTARVALVPPSKAEVTARRLAAAVDGFLDEAPEPPTEPVLPVASFDSLLLDVYEKAVERAAAEAEAYS